MGTGELLGGREGKGRGEVWGGGGGGGGGFGKYLKTDWVSMQEM